MKHYENCTVTVVDDNVSCAKYNDEPQSYGIIMTDYF